MARSSTSNLNDTRKEEVSGNASSEQKDRAIHGLGLLLGRRTGFGDQILKRARITEVSVNAKVDEPTKKEGRVVVEMDVEDDMINVMENMHGGCSAFLIDCCSTLPFAVINSSGSMGVSQALNMVYHAPAKKGDHLKIVSTTIAVGARVMSVRAEIWDTTNHRLVASAVHIKMEASTAKL